MMHTHIMKQSLNVSFNFDMFVIVNLSFLKAKQVAITNTLKNRQIKVKCLYSEALILPIFYFRDHANHVERERVFEDQ